MVKDMVPEPPPRCDSGAPDVADPLDLQPLRLVFVVWIALVGEDHTKSAHFAAILFSTPFWVSIAWLGFRVLGAAVVVPVAEELAFRGYLLTACCW